MIDNHIKFANITKLSILVRKQAPKFDPNPLIENCKSLGASNIKHIRNKHAPGNYSMTPFFDENGACTSIAFHFPGNNLGRGSFAQVKKAILVTNDEVLEVAMKKERKNIPVKPGAFGTIAYQEEHRKKIKGECQYLQSAALAVGRLGIGERDRKYPYRF